VTTWLFRLTYAVGVITILSGAFQLVAAPWELAFLQAQTGLASTHFFRIIGMFMVLFGGMLVHALSRPGPRDLVLLWTALQKFGAATAVGLGVVTAVFSPLALFVAGFDLASAIVLIAYRRTLQTSA
jgi:hypothetical protein